MPLGSTQRAKDSTPGYCRVFYMHRPHSTVEGGEHGMQLQLVLMLRQLRK